MLCTRQVSEEHLETGEQGPAGTAKGQPVLGGLPEEGFQEEVGSEQSTELKDGENSSTFRYRIGKLFL